MTVTQPVVDVATQYFDMNYMMFKQTDKLWKNYENYEKSCQSGDIELYLQKKCRDVYILIIPESVDFNMLTIVLLNSELLSSSEKEGRGFIFIL